MKIRCEAKKLMEAALLMKGGRRGKSHINHRSEYLFIEAVDGRAVAMGFNGEARLTYHLDAEILEEGLVSIPLVKTIAFLRGERGTLEISGTKSHDGVTLSGTNGAMSRVTFHEY